MSKSIDLETSLRRDLSICWEELVGPNGVGATRDWKRANPDIVNYEFLLPDGWSISTEFVYNEPEFEDLPDGLSLKFQDVEVMSVVMFPEDPDEDKARFDRMEITHHHDGDPTKVLGLLKKLVQPALILVNERKTRAAERERLEAEKAQFQQDFILKAIADLPDVDDETLEP